MNLTPVTFLPQKGPELQKANFPVKYILRSASRTKSYLKLSALSIYQLLNILSPKSPCCCWTPRMAGPCLIECYWSEGVTVISWRVINSNPKSIHLLLHYHSSNLNTPNYLEASHCKGERMGEKVRGLYWCAKPTSLPHPLFFILRGSALKMDWLRQTRLSSHQSIPKCVTNLIPFLSKKLYIWFLILEFAG